MKSYSDNSYGVWQGALGNNHNGWKKAQDTSSAKEPGAAWSYLTVFDGLDESSNYFLLIDGVDSNLNNHNTGFARNSRFWAAHSDNGVNVLFGDGHAGATPQSKVEEDFNSIAGGWSWITR